MAFADLVRFIPTLGGTTDWVYSSAVGGCQSPAAANVTIGLPYKTYAVSGDLTQWEVSSCVVATVGTFPRTTVLYNSSGTGAAAGQSGAGTKISFLTVPQVSVVALAEDLIPVGTFFSAYLSASQSTTNASYGKIHFDHKDVDPASWYDNTTNFRFQPTVAGYYEISGAVCGDGSTSISETDIAIYLNGTIYASALNLAAGVATTASIKKTLHLNGTDYVELWGNVTGTGTLVFSGGAAPIRCWFEAKLIG